MKNKSDLFKTVKSKSKFLKHVFNIILKLNNHPWKKVQKYFFVEKIEAQISGFAVVKKAPSPWKIKKKILPAYLYR